MINPATSQPYRILARGNSHVKEKSAFDYCEQIKLEIFRISKQNEKGAVQA